MTQSPLGPKGTPLGQVVQGPDQQTTLVEAAKERGWVTLRQFTEVADITYMTALRWCKLGMINYVQVGGQRRIYEEELARFLAYGTLPADPKAFAEEKQRRLVYKENAANRRASDFKVKGGKYPTS
jgi:hypothetical protein